MSSFKLRNVLNTSLILFLFNTFLFLSYASDDDHISSSSLYSINKDKGKERLYGGPEELENGHKEAHRCLFYGHLQEVRTQVFLNILSHPTIFLCYNQNDIESRSRVKLLAQDLSRAGIPRKNILYDDWGGKPGGKLNKLQYSDQISSSERVIVIGSPSLARPYEQLNEFIRTDINILRTRLSQKGAEGIIPVGFEGEYQDNFPQGIHFLNFRFLGDGYFYPFFDLLIDLYQLNPVKNPILKYQEDFLRRCKNIPEETLVSFQGAFEQSSEAVRENDKRVTAEMLAHDEYKNQRVAVDLITSKIPPKKARYQEPLSLRECDEDKLHPRRWVSITEKVLISGLPDRPEDFVESASESSQETYLTLLWQKLYRTGIATLSNSINLSKATVSGMGGLGKTTLALAYAYEALNYKAYNLIAWIPSETRDELMSGYKYLLQRLGLLLKGDEASSLIIDRVKEELLNQGRCLLIYDNVPSPDFLKNKVPQAGVDILITSRCNYGWGKGACIGLDVFRPGDSMKYLFEVTELEQTEENKRYALSLAQELGHLPLALSHAASYIRYMNDTTYGFSEYLKEFKEQPETHFDSHKNPFDEDESKGFLSHQHLIARTWSLAGKKINPLAKELMIYFSYLEPDSIVADAFLSCTKEKRGLKEALAQLSAFSLIKGTHPFYSIHRLVQLVIWQEQEISSFDNLKISLASILSSFEEYRHSLEQKFQDETRLTELNNFESKVTAMTMNATTLFSHLKRLAHHHSYDEVDFFNIKFKILGFEWMLRNSNYFLLKNKIYEALSHRELNPQEEQKRFLKKELKQKKIELEEKIFEETFEYLPKLLLLNLTLKNLTDVISTLKKVSISERAKFVEDVVTLVNSTGNFRILPFIISSNDPRRTAEDLLFLFTEDMDENDKDDLANSLMLISPSIAVQIVKNMFLSQQEIDKNLKIEAIKTASMLISSFSKVTTVNRLSTLTKHLNDQKNAEYIKALQEVDVFYRSEITEYINLLFLPTILKPFVIKALAKVISENQAQPQHLKRFLKQVGELTSNGHYKLGVPIIINDLAKINPKDRDELVKQVLALFPNEMMGENTRCRIIEVLARVPIEPLKFLYNAKLMITDNMNTRDKIEVIKALSNIESSDQLVKLIPVLQDCIKKLGKDKFILFISELDEIFLDKKVTAAKKFAFLLDLIQEEDVSLNNDKTLKDVATRIFEKWGCLELLYVIKEAID